MAANSGGFFIPKIRLTEKKRGEIIMARNTSGLIPASERTPEERAENGRKGGLKTQEQNRLNRNAQEVMRLYLNCKISQAKAREKLGEYADLLPKDATLFDVITLKQILESQEGNTKAFECVRDTAGFKPIERQEITADIMTDADKALLEKVSRRVGVDPDKLPK